ncbi:MAG: Zn-ribbon containing protein [Halobacteria archaeon]|nr:Zn-ribbon containing protein [Halobacteria archaeon]
MRKVPHQCVECGETFEDGSEAMLDGCPECGGTKFMFSKNPEMLKGQGQDEPSRTEEGIIEAETETTPTGFVMGTTKPGKPTTGTSEDEPETEDHDKDPESITPDREELRQELMDQFESIKIIEPGSYELNLMSLYNKEEKIIALREDGRYQVSIPSSWMESEDED